jgi:hypothetical protein
MSQTTQALFTSIAPSFESQNLLAHLQSKLAQLEEKAFEE